MAEGLISKWGMVEMPEKVLLTKLGAPKKKAGIDEAKNIIVLSEAFQVEIGSGANLDGELSLTLKGSGTMKIANLLLRVFDSHDDGITYKDDYCLQVSFKDLNRDGFRDLLITGVAVKHDEKTDAITGEVPIHLQYEYRSKDKIFKKKSGATLDYVEIEIGN